MLLAFDLIQPLQIDSIAFLSVLLCIPFNGNLKIIPNFLLRISMQKIFRKSPVTKNNYCWSIQESTMNRPKPFEFKYRSPGINQFEFKYYWKQSAMYLILPIWKYFRSEITVLFIFLTNSNSNLTNLNRWINWFYLNCTWIVPEIAKKLLKSAFSCRFPECSFVRIEHFIPEKLINSGITWCSKLRKQLPAIFQMKFVRKNAQVCSGWLQFVNFGHIWLNGPPALRYFWIMSFANGSETHLQNWLNENLK